MKLVITKTYLACNLPLPNDAGLQAKIAVMMEDLGMIPTAALDQVFRKARLSRGDSYFPSSGEMMKAWADVRAEHEREKEREETRRSLRALPEYYPEELARDSRLYVLDPTPEKLAKLKEKYPHAGF